MGCLLLQPVTDGGSTITVIFGLISYDCSGVLQGLVEKWLWSRIFIWSKVQASKTFQGVI